MQNNNNKLASIIQGCMTWGKWGANFSKQTYQQQIEACLKSGVTTFDHADIYGGYTTEKEFGTAIGEMKLKRENYQLISKCGIQIENLRNNKVKHYQYDAAYILNSVEQSLKQLQTEYLDVLLLHRPSPLMEVKEVESAVQQLFQQGKINQFGVSNFSLHEIELLQQTIPIEYNQFQVSLTHSESLTNGLLTFMQLHQIKPMAWNPLGSYFKETPKKLKKAVVEMGTKYSASEDQILLAWLQKHPSQVTPVIGTTNKKRMQAASIELKLELQDWFLLWEAAREMQVA